MGATSLLVVLALGADHAFAAASVHAEVRGSAPFADGASQGFTPELTLRPTVGAGWVAGILRAEVGYQPQLTATGLNVGLLHRLQAGAEWKLSPSRRARVDQQLTFGQYDTSSLASLGQPGEVSLPDVILPLGTVDYLTSDTAAELDGAIAPRLRLRGALGYKVSGGLSASAATLPLEQGPHLTLELSHQATRRDALSAQLRLTGDAFSTGTTSGIAEGSAAWRTDLSHQASLQLSAGAAAVATAGAAAPGEATPPVVPVAAASLSYGVPRLRLGLEARLAPQPDAQTGRIYERAGAGLSGEYKPRSDLSVRASGAGSWSVLGDNAGDRTVLGEAQVVYHQEPVEVEAGVRFADVVLSKSLISHATELRGFVGVTFKLATVR